MSSLGAFSSRIRALSVTSKPARAIGIGDRVRHRQGPHIGRRPDLPSAAGTLNQAKPNILDYVDDEECWPNNRVDSQDARGRGPMYAAEPVLSQDREEAKRQLHQQWVLIQYQEKMLLKLWKQNHELEWRHKESKKLVGRVVIGGLSYTPEQITALVGAAAYWSRAPPSSGDSTGGDGDRQADAF